jgi:hypothetical protein
MAESLRMLNFRLAGNTENNLRDPPQCTVLGFEARVHPVQ